MILRTSGVILQALEDAKISLEDIASVEVTGGSSRVPAIISILKDFFKKDPSRTLNATEVISRGCALNCAMLSPIFRYTALLSSVLMPCIAASSKEHVEQHI